MFTMKFTTGNAAFEGCPEAEIARILRHAAEVIENGAHLDGAIIRDANGNRIGQWDWEAAEEAI